MTTPGALAKLERAASHSHGELQAACRAYWAAPEARRESFRAARLATVERLVGAYTEGSRDIRTSGSTSGVTKIYRWGPNFDAHHRLDHDQRFEGIDYDTMFMVRIGEHRAGRPRMPPSLAACQVHAWGRLQITRLPDPARDAAGYVDMLRADTRRTPLLWFYPQQLLASERRGDGLLAALGDAVAWHCTGEVCPPELKAMAKAAGADLRDSMRVWNGGCGFFACAYGGTHWDDFASITRVDADGRLRATDLWNLAQRHVDHPTGDEVAITPLGVCRCGLPASDNAWAPRVLSLDRPGGRPLIYHDLLGVFMALAGLEEKDVVGVCFGVGETKMVVFYALLDPDRRVADGVAQALAEAIEVDLSATTALGIPYGVFKARRLFRATDAELDALAADHA